MFAYSNMLTYHVICMCLNQVQISMSSDMRKRGPGQVRFQAFLPQISETFIVGPNKTPAGYLLSHHFKESEIRQSEGPMETDNP